MTHIKRIDEMQMNEHYTSPIENKLQEYYADGVKGLHKNTSDSSWELMGETWDDVLNYLKNEGYTHVYDFSDGDTEIYEKDGVYYMMDIEQEEEGSWGSWIVDLTPIQSTVDKLLNNKDTLKERAEGVCYGRDDLLEVAERMSNEYGNPSVGEELCGVMADAAVKFLSKIRLNPSWDAAND